MFGEMYGLIGIIGRIEFRLSGEEDVIGDAEWV